MGAMRTRLTEMLGIEHPVMLAGMGGVSFARLVAAVSDAGGFGTLGAATMTTEELSSEMQQVRDLTAAPFGVDLLAALPERMVAGAEEIVKGGASLFVAGSRRAARDHRGAARRQRVGRVDVRQGPPRDRGGRSGLRLRDRAGHRGRRSHRHGRDVPARAADRRRGGRPRARRRGGWHLRRARARGRARARRRRRVDRHPLHRDTRSAHRSRLQGGVDPHARGRHGHQQGLHRQDVARQCATSGRSTSKSIRKSCARSRSRWGARSGRGRCTSVATRRPMSTPTRSATPPGQGVGAIDALIPAGDLVRQIVDEAERALRKASSYA